MSGMAISYDEVVNRLREAEEVIAALLNAQADAVVTPSGVHLLRLHETDRALHHAKTSLERLVEERTRGLITSNQKLTQEVCERKRAEAALAASESRFRALLESAGEAVIAVDKLGRIVIVNASTERMFGYERRELTGMLFDALIPGIRDFMRAQSDDSHSPSQAAAGSILEFTGRRKDGTELTVDVGLSLADANGESLALALITDVTERKRAEDNLRQTQKLESVGLLAAGVAHDFNNLLTAILGNASLLVDEVPPRASQCLQAVIDGAQKAAQVTRQLLAYAGKGHFHITDLDLSAVVRENIGLIRISIPRRISIDLHLEGGLPRIHADAGQIQQVLMNLVINAAEAIGESANGTIDIGTGEEEVPEGQAVAAGRYVRITVSDTGCGMSEATKARIFDPFFTTKVFGRGLGLSAVLGILRSCAATINIESTPGQGTTFKLLFPAVSPPSKTAAVETQTAPADRSSTILVVDDEDGVRAFASAALRRAGHTVLQASDGRQAVNMIRSGRTVDLILLDVTMPLMGGQEALEQIRELRPGISVVVTSGYGSDEARRLMASGADMTFLQKPFTADQLLLCVRRTLGVHVP